MPVQKYRKPYQLTRRLGAKDRTCQFKPMLRKTMLPEYDISVPPNFTPYKCECEKCQRIMTLIRRDIQATVKHFPIADKYIKQISLGAEMKNF